VSAPGWPIDGPGNDLNPDELTAASLADLHAKVDAIGVQLADAMEFIATLKQLGASVAGAQGMQATMLRSMVPGLAALGG